MGRATWYRWRPGEAAAGPLLRRAIPDWRGRSVVVISGTARIVVRLTDWCACPNGRIIDLDRASFARLSDPSRGVIPVIVEVTP